MTYLVASVSLYACLYVCVCVCSVLVLTFESLDLETSLPLVNVAVVVVSVHICICVSVFVCPVRALPFESLYLDSSFLVCRYTLRISMSLLYIKVISQGQRHGSKIETQEHSEMHTVAGDWPFIERQS